MITLVVILSFTSFYVPGFKTERECIEGMKIVQHYTPIEDIKLMACIPMGTKI